MVMEETRVKKYQQYRDSLKKRKGEILPSYTNHKISKKSADDVLNESREQTPTIPTLSISYQHIIEETKDREHETLLEKNRRKKYVLKIVLTIVGCLLLAAAITVAAIIIFK